MNVYYKILIMPNGQLTVACMQWFDEFDYKPNSFLTDESEEELEFDSEEKAVEWLKKNVKEHLIDPELRNIIIDREYYMK